MIDKLQKYLEENLKIEKVSKRRIFKSTIKEELNSCQNIEYADFAVSKNSIDDYIENNNIESNFKDKLFNFIDEKGLIDSEVYNKVHLDRRLFSKIRNDLSYHPSRETVILIGLALELTENEFEELLSSAAYFLPKNNYYDLIIRFCFKEGIYNINEVNDLLEKYNQKMFSV